MIMKFVAHLVFISFMVFFSGCKKKSKELTSVDIYLFNPITNEPYSGIDFKIGLYEKRDKYGLVYDFLVENIWSGKTSDNGKVIHSFRALKNDKYFYQLSFPSLPMNDFYLAGNYVTYSGFKNDDLEIKKDQINSKTFGFIKIISTIRHFKNVNCFSETDQLRYRFKSSNLNDWTGWSNNLMNYGYGCIDYTESKRDVPEGSYDFELEVTRNGQVNIVEYTFNLFNQNGTDTLNLFY